MAFGLKGERATAAEYFDRAGQLEKSSLESWLNSGAEEAQLSISAVIDFRLARARHVAASVEATIDELQRCLEE